MLLGKKNLNKEEDEQFKKLKRNQESNFHSVEISKHFDTVKCERFVLENLKRSCKVTDFENLKEYEPCINYN